MLLSLLLYIIVIHVQQDICYPFLAPETLFLDDASRLGAIRAHKRRVGNAYSYCDVEAVNKLCARK